MHTLTLFPLGNADSYLIELANGRMVLFDYANMRNPDDASDKRIDLADALRRRLDAQKRVSFDVVAFTHLDDDHIRGASQFFHFMHSRTYQGNGRIGIDELWVPAAVIVEDRQDLNEEGKIIQREARHRLKAGAGIRVFSRPSVLREWLEHQGLSVADRAHLMTDAGQLVPTFDKATDEVEFFVHSPFAVRHEGGLIDRNTCSLVLQATFAVDGVDTYFLLSADAPHDVLADIVNVTKAHHNEARLAWHVFKLSHHCSYRSLGPDKGTVMTEPVPEVAWLLEEQGAAGGIAVATSDPIPAIDTEQPPHRQAANYYKAVCRDLGGEFKATMEHPTAHQPAPLVITIGRMGAMVEKRIAASGITVTSQPAPRAGGPR